MGQKRTEVPASMLFSDAGMESNEANRSVLLSSAHFNRGSRLRSDRRGAAHPSSAGEPGRGRYLASAGHTERLFAPAASTRRCSFHRANIYCGWPCVTTSMASSARQTEQPRYRLLQRARTLDRKKRSRSDSALFVHTRFSRRTFAHDILCVKL